MPALSFLYQYAIGGTIFFLSTYLAIRSGSLDLSKPTGRRSLAVLLVGFAFLAFAHAFSVFILPEL